MTVGVPQGANITSATLDLELATNNQNGLQGKFYADDVDDAPAWGSGSRPSQATKTTASTVFPTFPAAGVNVAVAITAIIQELLDRTGFASGNDMRLFGFYESITGGSSYNTVEFDAKGTYGTPDLPRIVITYTVAGGLSIPVADNTYRRRRAA